MSRTTYKIYPVVLSPKLRRRVQQALADNGEVTSARRVYNREVTYIRVPELRLLLSSLTPQEAFGLGLASVQQKSDDGKPVIE